MTARDDPDDRTLEDLLRAALLDRHPLGELAESHLCALVGALESNHFQVALRHARAGHAPLPQEEEETMHLSRALCDALKALARPVRRSPDPRQVGEQDSQSTVEVHAAGAAGGAWTAPPRQDPAPPVVDETERINAAIEEIFHGFARSVQVRSQLGPDPLARRSLLHQWKAYHLGLLRLPPVVEVQWRSAIAGAIPGTWLQPDDRWLRIPIESMKPKILIPAFHDQPGVIASPDAPFEELVHSALGDQALQYRDVAALASQMLWLAQEDRAAVYAQNTDLMPLPDRYTSYCTALREKLDVFSKNASAGTDGGNLVIRAAQLTDVLRSVVHKPLAAQDSWWARRRDIAMSFVRMTAEKYAPEITVRDLRLGGSYKTIMTTGQSEPANDIRLAVEEPGTVGTVLDCLRPGLVTGSETKRAGRVIYGGDHAVRR